MHEGDERRSPTPPREAPRIQASDKATSFATTEYFTLQTARSATLAECAGRSSLFLTSVSSSVVALAFIGQSSELGRPFARS